MNALRCLPVSRQVGDRQMIIGGRQVGALSGERINLHDPSTGKTIGTVPKASAADVDAAVESACQAFASGVWRDLQPARRARILLAFADLVEKHAEELAHLETLDSGMLHMVAQMMPGEVAGYLRYYAGWATKIHGVTSDVSSPFAGEMHGYTLKQPVGVCALITPWNFPLSLAAIKIAPALAAGCTCVLKPSEEAPLSTLRLVELAHEAGVPPGVINCVTGLGLDAGAALAAHPRVSKVAFTGSTQVGKEIVRAASGNLKKVTLELGGKSPVIVFDDADIDAAVAGAAMGIFMRSGQACIAGSRLYVQRKSFDRVVEGIAGIAAAMKIGDAFASDTQLGPLISEKQLRRVASLVDGGVADGARLVTGGAMAGGEGYFMEPTILADPGKGSAVAREEIFGPVLCAFPFEDVGEVVAAANDSHYGLAAAIWSRDVGKVHRVARALEAGVVWANCTFVADPSLPVAGHKQSGWGAELGREGLDPYLATKAIYVSLGT